MSENKGKGTASDPYVEDIKTQIKNLEKSIGIKKSTP